MALSVNLEGRRVLVSGASSGIGRATCRAIVEAGGSVAMLARRKERLDELHEELGKRAHPVPADVTDTAALEENIATAAAALGGLDGVVAVAGKTLIGTIASGTPDKWRALFDINLMAPLATARYALAHFPTSGRRDVVVVGSAGSLTVLRNNGIYAASKRGLVAGVETLRMELALAGINVGIVLPGAFDSEALLPDGSLDIDGELVEDIPLMTPDGAPGSVDDVADAISYMISRPEGLSVNQLVLRPVGGLAP